MQRNLDEYRLYNTTMIKSYETKEKQMELIDTTTTLVCKWRDETGTREGEIKMSWGSLCGTEGK